MPFSNNDSPNEMNPDQTPEVVIHTRSEEELKKQNTQNEPHSSVQQPRSPASGSKPAAETKSHQVPVRTVPFKQNPDNLEDNPIFYTLDDLEDELEREVVPMFRKAASEIIKLIHCLRFIKVNKSYIEFAFSNNLDSQIYSDPKDKDAKIIKDFKGNPIHIGTNQTVEEFMKSWESNIAQFEKAIKQAHQKKELSVFSRKLIVLFTQNVPPQSMEQRIELINAFLQGRKSAQQEHFNPFNSSKVHSPHEHKEERTRFSPLSVPKKIDPDEVNNADLHTLNGFRNELVQLRQSPVLQKAATDALKVVNCLRFIKVNETFINYAFRNIGNSWDTNIYLREDDYKKGVIRDLFDKTAIHIDREKSSDALISKWRSNIQQFEHVIKIAQTQGLTTLFVERMQYNEATGCVEQRMESGLLFGAEVESQSTIDCATQKDEVVSKKILEEDAQNKRDLQRRATQHSQSAQPSHPQASHNLEILRLVCQKQINEALRLALHSKLYGEFEILIKNYTNLYLSDFEFRDIYRHLLSINRQELAALLLQQQSKNISIDTKNKLLTEMLLDNEQQALQLIASGADVNYVPPNHNEHESLFLLAVRNQKDALVQAMSVKTINSMNLAKVIYEMASEYPKYKNYWPLIVTMLATSYKINLNTLHGSNTRNSTLHRAVMNGLPLEYIQVLCKYGADINHSNLDGFSPLELVMKSGESEVVAGMIKAQNPRNLDRFLLQSLFHCFIEEDRPDLVAVLFDCYPERTTRTIINGLLLHAMNSIQTDEAQQPILERIKLLCHHNADISQAIEDKTLLQCVIDLGRFDLVSILLTGYISSRYRKISDFETEWTALIAQNRPDLALDLLLKIQKELPIELKNQLLEQAILNNYPQCAIKLLDLEANPNLISSTNNMSLFSLAIEHRLPDVVIRMLHMRLQQDFVEEAILYMLHTHVTVNLIPQILQNIPSINLNRCKVPATNNSSLHEAVLKRVPSDVMELLCKRGADITVLNQEGKSPLVLAIDSHQFDQVRVMLKHSKISRKQAQAMKALLGDSHDVYLLLDLAFKLKAEKNNILFHKKHDLSPPEENAALTWYQFKYVLKHFNQEDNDYIIKFINKHVDCLRLREDVAELIKKHAQACCKYLRDNKHFSHGLHQSKISMIFLQRILCEEIRTKESIEDEVKNYMRGDGWYLPKHEVSTIKGAGYRQNSRLAAPYDDGLFKVNGLSEEDKSKKFSELSETTRKMIAESVKSFS
jgi:ankyrin repeat protein